MDKRVISLIVAMSNNRVIGKDNKMLWHLPNDFKYFKEKTLNKPVIMGRKTFESIGRPLPNRQNIVITSDSSYSADGIIVVDSLEKALDITCDEKEVFIIGGGQIYKQSLNIVDKLYLTIVDTEIDGDAYFPDFSTLSLKTDNIIENFKDDRHAFDYKFCEYSVLKH